VKLKGPEWRPPGAILNDGHLNANGCAYQLPVIKENKDDLRNEDACKNEVMPAQLEGRITDDQGQPDGEEDGGSNSQPGGDTELFEEEA
jgi:hypothetical protein